MNFEIKDYIIDELDNNELTELIYSLVLYHRDNTIMNDDKFSSRIIRFAYKNVLYDFKQKTILDEKKKQRAEINRQNALKRWGKSAGKTAYTNGNTIGNTIGDAIAYANEIQKLCKSNTNRNANKMQDASDKNISNEITIQKDIPVTANDNTNNNIDNDAEDMRTLMQNVCKNNANIMRNYATENLHKPFDMKKENELYNKLNSNTNCNANGNANEYANDYANEHTNSIEDKVVPCSSENKENTIPASDLKPVSYASEKGNILSVDNLLSDDDGSINEETDLSVQKIKEKEKRNKKEKENIYNNIYNNKYIYNNNIFKEEKENLIKEKEESILSSNQDVKQAELESDSVSMQKENQKIIQSQPSGQPGASDTKPKRFKVPSVDEVKTYITEKGYSIDAEAFVDYYTSKGWVVGKSPMKDWRAAVRTWNNNKKFNSSSGSSYYANNRPNRMLTPNEKEAEEYADKLCQRLREKGILTEDNKPVDYNERKYKHG